MLLLSTAFELVLLKFRGRCFANFVLRGKNIEDIAFSRITSLILLFTRRMSDVVHLVLRGENIEDIAFSHAE